MYRIGGNSKECIGCGALIDPQSKDCLWIPRQRYKLKAEYPVCWTCGEIINTRPASDPERKHVLLITRSSIDAVLYGKAKREGML